MKYHACLEYLQKLGNEYLTMKLGLDHIRTLLRELQDPQEQFTSVLVAGTNGKGSVSRFLESLLRSRYPRCGLYTSPHLRSLHERIRIAGENIDQDLFARSFSQVVRAVRRCRFKYHPTYFEMMTATAFVAFREADSKMVVLEVGLGGRLDTTNVVEPLVSVITPINLDHQHVLGNTLREIAGEKAGIMRRDRPVVVGLQVEEARQALQEAAHRSGAIWLEVDPAEIRARALSDGRYHLDYRGISADLDLFGLHQAENAALALRALQCLAESQGWDLAAETLTTRLQAVRPHGVLEILDEHPLTMIDGGHNPQALAALAAFVKAHAPRPRTLVFGIMQDKDAESSLSQISDLFDQVFLVPVDSPRSADPETLRKICPEGTTFQDPMVALKQAREQSRFVLVTGSFYLAGEVLERWKRP